MNLPRFAVKHPAIVAIGMVALIVFGLVSLKNTKQDLFPNVSGMGISVMTTYPGVGAKDVEKEITTPIEDELAELSDVKSMESSSMDSASFITMRLKEGTKMYEFIPYLRERLNTVKKELPKDIDEPIIIPWGSSAVPIFSFQIVSEGDPTESTEFLEKNLIPSISKIKGVSRVGLLGGTKRQLEIRVHLDDLTSKNISIMDIYSLLKYNNVSIPAGSTSFHGKQINLKTVGEFSSIEEVENMVVGYKDHSYIRLKDVADVRFSIPARDHYIVSKGKNIVAMDIRKKDSGNSIYICKETKKILTQMEHDYNGLFHFRIIKDNSVDIQRSIGSVARSAGMGILLSVLVLLLFLHNLRTTLIISASLPLSIIFAFIGMKLSGETINILTLSGITIAIGMVVDSSIVMLDNIYKHYRQKPDAKEASIIGSNEVSGAVIASATTSISVFAPLIALTGIIGIIMSNISYTLVFSLLASTFVAIIVVPFLTSNLMKEEKPEEKSKVFQWIAGTVTSGLKNLEAFYRKVLDAALNNRRFVVFTMLGVLILSFMILSTLGIEFIPASDSSEMEIYIKTPESYNLAMTRAKVAEVERLILKEVPETENTIFYVGMSSDMSSLRSKNRAYGRIHLVPTAKRKRSIFKIINLLQKNILEKIPDVDVTLVNGGLDSMVALSAGGHGYMVEISGNDFDQIAATAHKFKEILDKQPTVRKTEMNVSFKKDLMVTDLLLNYMGNLGVTPYEAALASRIFFYGMKAGKFRTKKKNYPIFLTSDINGKEITEDTINQITIKSKKGKMLSFANFSKIHTEPTVSAINHKERQKSITVTAYLTTSETGTLTKNFTREVHKLHLPQGIHWKLGGSSGMLADSISGLLMVLGVALFLVYSVMVIQFENFMQPLIVMASIPFALIGVVAGLLMFGSNFSIVAFLGVISLAGVVVNNAIVLIDYTNLLRKRDQMPLRQALLSGASSRIQPILMTTLTTMLGILPLALGRGNGAEVYAPLGQAIFGGLLTSTLITLVLIPVLYDILEERLEKK